MNNAKKSLVPHRRFKEFQNAGAWEQRKLGEITKTHSFKQYISEAFDHGKYMVIQQGENPIAGYANGDPFENFKDVTLFGDHTLSLFKPQEKFFVASGGIKILSPSLKMNGMFYYYLLEKYRPQSEGYKRHFTIMKKSTALFPIEIDEQIKISNFLEELDSLIALHQRKLNKLKKLKSAYLTEMFPDEGEHKPKRRFAGFTDDWEQRKLGDVVERFDNLRIPVTSSKRKRGITPYYGANGIQDYVQGYTHDGEFVLVAEDGANDLQNYPIHYVNGKVWVNNHAHVLQGKKDIADNLFLVNAIKRIKFETYLVGGSRAKLNADVMMKLPIKMPKLNEQQKLGKYFSRIDTLIALHQRELNSEGNDKNGKKHY